MAIPEHKQKAEIGMSQVLSKGQYAETHEQKKIL